MAKLNCEKRKKSSLVKDWLLVQFAPVFRLNLKVIVKRDWKVTSSRGSAEASSQTILYQKVSFPIEYPVTSNLSF